MSRISAVLASVIDRCTPRLLSLMSSIFKLEYSDKLIFFWIEKEEVGDGVSRTHISVASLLLQNLYRLRRLSSLDRICDSNSS